MSENQEDLSGAKDELFSFDDSVFEANNEKQLVEIEDTRNGPHLLSKYQGFMLLLKFCVGIGWFSIPAAFKYSGILVGIVSTGILGALTAFGMRKTVEVAWEVARRTGNTVVSFGDIGGETAKVFNSNRGDTGRFVVNITLAVTLLSLICPEILLVAAMWKQGFEQLGWLFLDTRTWILIAFFVLAPLFFIKRADILTIVAFIGNSILGISMIILFVHFFAKASSWRAHMNVTWSKLPLTIGILSFAFEVAPLVLSVENVMKKPKDMPFVINGVVTLATFLYIAIGSFGYVYCQESCKDTIILNLPSTWYFAVVKVFLGTIGCVSSLLIVYTVFNMMETTLVNQIPEKHQALMSALVRMFVLSFFCGISAAVLQLANIMALVGAMAVSIIGFIFPAIVHMILLYHKQSKLAIAGDFVLLTSGIFLLVSVVYTSVAEIVRDY